MNPQHIIYGWSHGWTLPGLYRSAYDLLRYPDVGCPAEMDILGAWARFLEAKKIRQNVLWIDTKNYWVMDSHGPEAEMEAQRLHSLPVGPWSQPPAENCLKPGKFQQG